MHDDQWRTSSYSQGTSNCVEFRTDAGQALIRDTQHRHAGHLTLPTTEWAVFLNAVRTDEIG